MLKKFITLTCLSVTTLLAEPNQVPTPLSIGAEAPAFNLKGVDGKNYSLDSFKDAEILVVIFTSNHCPDARASRQRINNFAKDYAKKGIKVVLISSNDPKALSPWELGYSVYGDTFDEMKIVAEEEGYIHPFLYDGDAQAASKSYGALATPHCFVFDKNRQLAYQGRFDNGRRDPGPASENTLIDIVNSMLLGQIIDEKSRITRTFGCSTKWTWKKDKVAEVQEKWDTLPVSVSPLSDLGTVKKLAQNDSPNVRVINFWSTTCGPCVAEFPDLAYINQRFSRRPFELITISLDAKDQFTAVEDFIKKAHLPASNHKNKEMQAAGRTTNNYHFQSDKLDDLANAFDAKWTGPMPHTVVMLPNGKITYRHTGEFNSVTLTREIVKALETVTNSKKH